MKKCEHVIARTQPCCFNAKIKVTLLTPGIPSKYFCYSHLMSFIKATEVSFTVDKVR